MSESRSFPLISNLPKLLDASDWMWERPPLRSNGMGIRSEWWIGEDGEGCRWLVKMTNSLRSHREHVFASLAQELGISCQSSTYLLIQSESAEPRAHTPCSEPYQLAICLMEEHAAQPCSKRCALSALRGKTLDFAGIALGSDSGIAHFEDLVRGDVLGHLCGQAEPHDHLFTQQHEYVVIDNELMFAGNPCIEQCRWLSNKDAHPLIAQVCLGLVGIRDDKLGEMAAVPGGYIVSTALNLYDQLLWAKAAALKYIKNFKTPFSALSLRL